MIGHYLRLAVRSFRRTRALTALMVLAIALGVGASMTTLTVLRVLSTDPLPGVSDRIYRVQLDAEDMSGFVPGAEPISQLTRFDAEALVRAGRARRQSMMTGGHVAIEPDNSDLDPFYASARYASADFFAMFRVPFAEGGGWTARDDEASARVAVISRELATRLFGRERAVGRNIRLAHNAFRVVGVIDRWRPVPHFYDLNTGRYSDVEQVFVPFSTSRELALNRSGSISCWGDVQGDGTSLAAPCAWIQVWVELESAGDAAAYRDFLIAYSEEQRAAGRFERPANIRLRNVMAWLDRQKVVPDDARLQTYLALAFLLVCLINTVGLLLAKFLRRSPEIGVRRALGAPRRAIFAQFLVEAGAVGLLGGVLGLGLAWLGLWAVRHQPSEHAELAQLDSMMLGATFALAVASSLLAGILPAWRACCVTPALQLKSQ